MMRRTPAQVAVLVRSVEHIVKRYASKYHHQWPRISRDEFYSAGLEGVRRATEVYDDARRFPPLARRFIVWAMQECVRKATRPTDPMLAAVIDASLRDDGGEGPPHVPFDGTFKDARAAQIARNRFRLQQWGLHALLSVDRPIDPEQLAVEREETEHAVTTMNRVIGALPREQRAVFEMHRIHDKQHTEVAAAVGISVSTVQRHLLRVEAALKEGLVAAGIESRARVAHAWSRIREAELASEP